MMSWKRHDGNGDRLYGNVCQDMIWQAFFWTIAALLRSYFGKQTENLADMVFSTADFCHKTFDDEDADRMEQ